LAENKTKKEKANILTPVSIVIAGLLISLSVLVSNGSLENLLNSKTDIDNTVDENAPKPTQPPTPSAQSTVKVSVDDDPVLGDKDAPVTIIEFSDYECPFCKRAFQQTYPVIKEQYIKTGKVKLVFRDLPLSFHEPMATKEAIAANCARKQGGDKTYFIYHDEIFKRTTSNGNGLTENGLTVIAEDLGFNINKFNSCLRDLKQEEEVKKDLADATKAGATGTPTFFIGKTTKDGVIEGTKIVGAQPIEAFRNVIEDLLSE
jgi:protein-disulfide isomerase